MEQQSFLNELKTKIENRCALWRVGWLGKIVCSPIFWIVLFLSVRFFISDHSVIMFPDTFSYTYNYKANIFRGETDLFRTPLYPSFISLIQKTLNDEKIFDVDSGFCSYDKIIKQQYFSFTPYLQEDSITALAVYGELPTFTIPVDKPSVSNGHIILSGQKSCPYVVYSQFAIWVIAVSYFYGTIKKCFSNSFISFFLVLFIGNYFLFEQRIILTESLALSMTLIMFGMLINHVYKPRYYLAVCINCMAFLMVMLRPAFLIFYVLLLGFWFAQILFSSNNKKIGVVGLLTLLLSSSFVYGYCELNRRNYGIFTISSVGTINQSNILIRTGFYKNCSNKEYVDFLDKQNIDPTKDFQYEVLANFTRELGFPALKEFTSQTIKNNFISYILLTLKRMYWDMSTSNFQLLYLVVMIEFLLLISMSISLRLFPWTRLIFWLYFSVMLFGIYYGAHCCFPRLIIPALPVYFIICARYIDMIFVAYSKSKTEFIQYLKSTL
ncbi:MAG: hypothetical protein IJQ39_06815 [Thermoguttaceae bacterium]|nr:hypothetical protein [Thermoguttaceae bacterium]